MRPITRKEAHEWAFRHELFGMTPDDAADAMMDAVQSLLPEGGAIELLREIVQLDSEPDDWQGAAWREVWDGVVAKARTLLNRSSPQGGVQK